MEDVFRKHSWELGESKALAISKIGRAHQRVGASCHDYYGVADLGAGKFVLVVSDGVGSSKYPDMGAKCAVEAVLGYVREHPEASGDDLSDVFSHVQDELLALSESEESYKLRDFSCTLAVTLLTPTDTYCAQVGDSGTVLGLNEDQEVEWSYPCIPPELEFANSVHSIATCDLQDALQVVHIKQAAKWVFMLTDGMLETCIQQKSQEPVAGYFPPFLKLFDISPELALTHMNTFMSSDLVKQRTEDDLTILIFKHAV